MSNTGFCKKIGGSHFVQVTVNEPRCKIKIEGDRVYVDDRETSHDTLREIGADDLELHLAITRLNNEAVGKEKWILTNVSNIRVTTGFCNHNVLMPGESMDALLFATPDEINNSPSIQGAKKRGLITLDIVKKD